MTLIDRIERIARKLEDPETCEWDDGHGDIVPIVSTGRFWQRWSDIEPKDAVLCGPAQTKYSGTAGWLIECLVRAGLEVNTSFWRDGCYAACVTTNYDDGTLKHAVRIRDADLLTAVVEAAEAALGIEA